MINKTTVFASVAVLFGASTLSNAETANNVVQQLSHDGYTSFEVKQGLFRDRVVAITPNGSERKVVILRSTGSVISDRINRLDSDPGVTARASTSGVVDGPGHSVRDNDLSRRLGGVNDGTTNSAADFDGGGHSGGDNDGGGHTGGDND